MIFLFVFGTYFYKFFLRKLPLLIYPMLKELNSLHYHCHFFFKWLLLSICAFIEYGKAKHFFFRINKHIFLSALNIFYPKNFWGKRIAPKRAAQTDVPPKGHIYTKTLTPPYINGRLNLLALLQWLRWNRQSVQAVRLQLLSIIFLTVLTNASSL